MNIRQWQKTVLTQGAIPATARERGVRRAAQAAADAPAGQEAKQVRDPQALHQVHQTSAGSAEVRHFDAYSYPDLNDLILAQMANGSRGATWDGRERGNSSAVEHKSAKPSGRVAKMPLKEIKSHITSSHRRSFDGPCGFQSNQIV